MNPEILFKNGNIITMDGSLSKYRWLAAEGDKIAAMGCNDDYPSAATVIDLKERTMLPGFIDSHLHGTCTGQALISADLRNSNSIDELFSSVNDKCMHTEKGQLVLGLGMSAETVKEKRLPTRLELDAISRVHPILLHHVTLHGCVMNSKAYEMSGLNTLMDGVETFHDGTFNGVVSDDSAYYMALNNINKCITEEDIENYIKAFTSFMPSRGITTAHSLDGQDFPADIPIWHHMQGKHPIHIINYLETLDVQKAIDFGYPRVGGCIALDGSRIMGTMALDKPYINNPSRGTLYYTDETIYKFMKHAHSINMQLSLHVGGERAIDQFIYNLYRVEKEQGFKDLRHRPEHFSMPSDSAIELAAEMKLALPMQPIFTKLWDEPEQSVYEKNLGPERAKRMEPFAEIVKKGGMICGGSDSPVSLPDPMMGIHLLVNNPRESRNIDLTNAIKIFTINGAWAAHEENIKGTLEIGKLADLVVLSKDPYEDLNHISDIKIEMTVVSGKIRHSVES